MRKVSLIVLLTTVSFVAMSQYKLKIDEVDEFSGDLKKMTNSVKLGKCDAEYPVYSQVRRSNEYIFIVFTVHAELGCVSKGNTYAYVKFMDGSTMKMYHFGDIECGDPLVYMLLPIEGDLMSDDKRGWTEDMINEEQDRVLKLLKAKKIEKIRFQGTEYYTDITVDVDRQDALMKLLSLVQ